MPKTIIAANWKVNKTIAESVEFIDQFMTEISDTGDIEVVICPPFTAIQALKDRIPKGKYRVGAQNVFWKDNCAYTGEISPGMIKEAGCDYVIVGHSERREHFGETDWVINQKIKAALEENLKVIFCVGETAKDRNFQLTFSIIETQLKKGLVNITQTAISNLVIAYEPVWAIGTGVNASPEQAQEVHVFIRKIITDLYQENVAEQISILYGGSVKPDNVIPLMAEKDINGALIGGASLHPDSLAKIIENVKKEG